MKAGGEGGGRGLGKGVGRRGGGQRGLLGSGFITMAGRGSRLKK